ncbi:MAG: type II toxin-antitoxin system VapC family toxin [Chitinophagaceae bacterium]|nr:MAG: type II toxin-antitoxin system VapC family toxin [Chitinophagaceae bacterium]
MDVLLDTHTVIWFLNGDSQLSKTARATIEDSQNTKWVSVASIWEIAVKVSLQKLEFAHPLSQLEQLMQQNGFLLLDVSLPHALQVATIPFHHRDPFDRLLISQAMCENMALLSRDGNFGAYEVEVIW